MILQPVEHDDLSACAALYLRVFNAAPWNEGWEERAVTRRLEDCWRTPGFFGLKARAGNEVVGIVLGYLEQWDKSSHFYLKEMCVISELQNRGVGTALMEALEAALRERGCQKIYLLTARDTGAQAFYEKRGFYVSQKMIMMGKWLVGE